MAEQQALLFCIWEVLDSILGPQTSCPDWGVWGRGAQPKCKHSPEFTWVPHEKMKKWKKST